MSLLQYLSRRLLLSALLVSSGIFYIIYILYQWGLDDSTEYYLQQDMLWAKEILANTQELPKNSQFKKFYLISESNSIIPKEYQAFLQRDYQQETTSEYFFLQDDEIYHYGLVQQINSDEQLMVVHQFIIDDEAEGMTLLEVSIIASMLLISMMLLDAWLIYRRIARSMQHLSFAAKKGNKAIKAGDDEFIEINEIIDSLSAALEAVEDKSQKERLFIQTLSHELRTPMATVQVALELLAKRDMDNKLREKLEVISTSNQQMQGLSRDLLSLWSNTQQNDETAEGFSIEHIDIEDEIKQVITDLDKAYPCQQRFVIKSPLATKKPVLKPDAAKSQLRLLLNNLCKNAMVHSEGEIQIVLEDHQLIIQNESSQAEVDPLVAGAGIGLLIATRAAELLGWKMEIETTDIKYAVRLVY
jgi:signal transduction histidine kinase